MTTAVTVGAGQIHNMLCRFGELEIKNLYIVVFSLDKDVFECNTVIVTEINPNLLSKELILFDNRPCHSGSGRPHQR